MWQSYYKVAKASYLTIIGGSTTHIAYWWVHLHISYLACCQAEPRDIDRGLDEEGGEDNLVSLCIHKLLHDQYSVLSSS